MHREEYISFLKVISALAVVLLHANGIFWAFSYERYWLTANIIESVFYFAVPVFFMISGVTLLDYRERYSTKVYFQKRFFTVFIPFLFWSIFILFYSLILGRISISDLSFASIIDGIINSKFLSFYWFFMPLFAIYLSIPIISLIPKNIRKTIFEYIIGVFLVFNSFLPLVFNLLKIPYNSSLYIPVLGGYIIWIFIGYYLDRFDLNNKSRKIIYILGILGLLLQIVGTWFFSYQNGYVDQMFKGYNNLPSLLYSSAFFLFIKENYHKLNFKGILSKLISLCEKETFGVYLIQYYLMEFFILVLHFDPYSISYRLGAGVLIFLISIFIIKALHKIPIINKIC